MTSEIICPKCNCNSGDDWSQCKGLCPMIGSPFYSETVIHRPWLFDGWKPSCKQDVVDLLFEVQTGFVSCRRASDILFPAFMNNEIDICL